MSHELNDQELFRRQSLATMREMGIEPYPAAEYVVNAHVEEVKANFNEEEKREVSMAGRLMSRRIMGKASFAELKDSTGRMQLYISRDEICPGENKDMYNTVFKKLLDIGDFIGVKGYVFRTQTGEISIHVSELTVLSKALRPLPIVKTDKDGNVHDAFEDPELRFRQRYVDLVVNEGVKDIFVKRNKVYTSMREYFNSNGYMEVETPVLQSIPGGASARPFITHHNALDIPLYLRIANELYLKRLIVGGFEGVYEFSKNFRNEGMDKTHNPEFTCMEIYVSYKDYKWMMEFTEKMLEKICMDVNGTTEVKMGDNITVVLPDPVPLDVTAENIPLDIVYEDDDLLIVDKPAGLLSVESDKETECAYKYVAEYLRFEDKTARPFVLRPRMLNVSLCSTAPRKRTSRSTKITELSTAPSSSFTTRQIISA